MLHSVFFYSCSCSVSSCSWSSNSFCKNSPKTLAIPFLDVMTSPFSFFTLVMNALLLADLIPGMFLLPLKSSSIRWISSCSSFALFLVPDVFFLFRSFNRCFSPLDVLLLFSISLPIFPSSFESWTFSILTPIHAQRSSIRALTCTTQVRSSGSQVFVGYRNHRAEPVAVLRRTPILTDEQRQQRVGSRALAPSDLWPQSAKEGVRESQGLDRPRSCLLSPGKLNTRFDFVPHGQTIGTLQTLYMASRSVNQDVSLDDEWRSIDQVKPQRTVEQVREVLCQVRPKDSPLRSQVINRSSWRQAICTCTCISWIMSQWRPGFSRGHRLEHQGGTSVRKESADDAGVASDPVNVRDGVIAVPRTDWKVFTVSDVHIRYSAVVEPEVYNMNKKSSLESSKALCALLFHCRTRRAQVSLRLSDGDALQCHDLFLIRPSVAVTTSALWTSVMRSSSDCAENYKDHRVHRTNYRGSECHVRSLLESWASISVETPS